MFPVFLITKRVYVYADFKKANKYFDAIVILRQAGMQAGWTTAYIILHMLQKNLSDLLFKRD